MLNLRSRFRGGLFIGLVAGSVSLLMLDGGARGAPPVPSPSKFGRRVKDEIPRVDPDRKLHLKGPRSTYVSKATDPGPSEAARLAQTAFLKEAEKLRLTHGETESYREEYAKLKKAMLAEPEAK